MSDITILEEIKLLASELSNMSPKTQLEIVKLCKNICLKAKDYLVDLDENTINDILNNIDEIETNLSNEITRATAKENEIIDDLDDEIERATTNENLLNTKITNLKNMFGFIEITDATGTLTDEQYAEALKPYCIICLNNMNLYYKQKNINNTITFSSFTIGSYSTYWRLGETYINVLENKTYQLNNTSLKTDIYSTTQTDALLNAIKSEIGYIELDAVNTSGTLTDEQYAEILKPHCIINYTSTASTGRNGFYHKNNSSSYIQFMRIETHIDNQNNQNRITQYMIEVYNDKTYSFATSQLISQYSNDRIDTLLNGKQNALEFNPSIPSGTTPTPLANLKDGNNYYSLGGGSQVYKHEIAILDSNDDGVGALSLLSSNNIEADSISSLSSLLRNYGFAGGTYFYNSLEAVAIYSSSSNNVLVTYDDRSTSLTEQAGYSVYDTVTPL